MAVYTSRLSMPLSGLSPEAVWSELQAALAADGRVAGVSPEPEPHDDEDESIEHVSINVRFAAPSSSAAHQIASELHDAALQRVLASVPPESPIRGWTSSFQHPEHAPE
jgi:hypothetical protein